MNICVIGLNHKLADLTLRELVAKACQRRFFLENPLGNGSFVLLSTCNRCELYFSTNDMVASHQRILQILKEEIPIDHFIEIEQRFYTFFGIDCFVHLASVTAGLDSAIIAETEIQGQVRSAYTAAVEVRPLSKELHFLFQKSLKIGKKVRRGYVFEKSLPDLEHAILLYAMSHFDGSLPQALFIGASEINIKIARFFKQKKLGFAFCNRSKTSVLDELSCPVLPWHHLSVWQTFDWVICATKSPSYIIHSHEQIINRTRPQLLIDLSVPRNIDPKITIATLVNIDYLQQLLESRKEVLVNQIKQAEKHLASCVEQHIAHFFSQNIINCTNNYTYISTKI
jgi:glutamyl-tRNA reductase